MAELLAVITLFLEDSNVEPMSDDEDSSDDSEFEDMVNSLGKEKVPKNSIINYYEVTVQGYRSSEFMTHFRISPQLFWNLSDAYAATPEYQQMLKYNPHRTLLPDKILAIFLWFTAHEACSYRDVADRFHISLSTVHWCIIRGVVFFSNMSSQVIKWPSDAEMQQEAAVREVRCGIPGVFGCVDGTKIVIDPPVNKDCYIDRKGDVTVTVQGVCNMKKKFIDVCIGFPGSVHDSRVLQNSKLIDKLGHLPVGLRLLADSAYPCLRQLMTPYKDNGHLTAAQTHFNRRLSKERIDIEHSFGILKQRFRQLYHTKIRGMKFICHFIRASIVLHNLADEDDFDFQYADPETLDVHNAPVVTLDDLPNGNLLRSEIAQHLFANVPNQ